MSLHYLLDGYNIIKQTNLAGKKLEDSRNNLIRFIENYRPQGSLKNKVTVVFDGRMDVFGEIYSSVVEVIFSRGETADEKIKDIVLKAKNKKTIVVVTNDRGIKYHVRPWGASVISVDEFMQKVTVKKASSSMKLKAESIKNPSKMISKTLEYKINEELKGIWLKKNL